MQANPARLRALLDKGAAAGGDLSPVGDPAIVAHLAFVAEAVAALAAPAREAHLRAFADGAPGWLAQHAADAGSEMERVGEAHALEASLQFGDAAGADPSNRTVIDRRVRMIAWTHVFLDGLEVATGDTGLATRAREWMADHQGVLADTIFTMDRRAKEAAVVRGGPDAIADRDVVNRIGQAAVMQAHMRFLVEAIASGARR